MPCYSVRLFLCGISLILGALPLSAALRLGLGEAVAKRSAELIDKSGASTPSPRGDSVAATLPSCPAGDIYDTAPIDLTQLTAIEPLGHVAPSPHTFPSDHLYFYRSTTTPSALPLYAPGTIHVTSVGSSEILTASPPYTDYSVTFYACRELRSYISHIKTLSTSLLLQAGAIDENCSTYTTGATFRSCTKSTNITVRSGDVLGYTAPVGAFDFGSYDMRMTPRTFAAPRHGPLQPYAACTIDYFTSGLRATMESMLGRFDGGHPRTVEPICGEINDDLPGTARGDWYKPGVTDNPEDPHVALIINNISAPQQTISVGNSLANQVPAFYTFNPITAGQVNRDFAQVTPDGRVYCYDSFFDPVGQPASGSPSFILQLTSATTLRLESQAAPSCGTGPWAFTANAVDFQR